jgi:hypothetical protein
MLGLVREPPGATEKILDLLQSSKYSL